MTTGLEAEQLEALEEATAALQPFYDSGDDGDAVRIALNAIAGLLGQLRHLMVPKDDGLNYVLKAMRAPAGLRSSVQKLYKAAERGAYGDGLTQKDANKVNDIIQDVVDPLTELVQRPVRKRRPKTRAGVRVRGRA